MLHLFYKSGSLYAAISDEKREYFYEDGTLKTREHVTDGKLDGESMLFWPDGTPKRKCHFENGVRHGLDQIWDEAGILCDEGSFEWGKPVGTHRRYNKGKLIEEIEYLGGGRFNLREWNDAGEIRIEAVWNEFDYKERTWDRFQNIWIEKEGFWNGSKLVYV